MQRPWERMGLEVGQERQEVGDRGAEQVAQSVEHARQVPLVANVFEGQVPTHLPSAASPEGQRVQVVAVPMHDEQDESQAESVS